MMSITDESQLDKRIIEERDRRLGISTLENKRNRRDIVTPVVDPGTNVIVIQC